MPGNVQLVYKICREQAGYTLRQAAELLHISVRMLCRYESGETLVPNDVVDSMVRLYSDNYLAVEHLRQSSEAAARLLPEITDLDFRAAVVRYFNQLDDLYEAGRELLQMAEDNKLDEAERARFEGEIRPRLARAAGVMMEIQLSAGKTRGGES